MVLSLSAENGQDDGVTINVTLKCFNWCNGGIRVIQLIPNIGPSI